MRALTCFIPVVATFSITVTKIRLLGTKMFVECHGIFNLQSMLHIDTSTDATPFGEKVPPSAKISRDAALTLLRPLYHAPFSAACERNVNGSPFRLGRTAVVLL
jgi:hypothetical protein